MKKFNKLTLQSIKLKEKVFNEIISSSLSELEYIYLSSNCTLNEQQIEYLFLKKIDAININLLRNKNCSKEKLDEFILLNDKVYNIAIAHNKSLSKTNIEKLIKQNDNDVIMSLKFNNLL